MPKSSARADRDLGLDGVIAGTERIGFGIEEAAEALALIVLQGKEIGQRRDYGGPGAGDNEYPQGQAGQEHDHASAHDQDKRGV